MDFIADILMIAGTFGVFGYCFILSRKLKRFSTLDTQMGGAIAVLSGQVDDLTRALDAAKKTAARSAGQLEALTTRAEATAARLEVLLATMHDLPGEKPSHAQKVRIQQVPEETAAPARVRILRRASRRGSLEAAE